MNTILIIGAGAAGSVVAQKCVKQPDVFNTGMLYPERLISVSH